MDVFGHDDPCEEMEVCSFLCGLQVIDEEVFDCAVGEEGESVVTGEGEESGVVFLLDSFHFLWWIGHEV